MVITAGVATVIAIASARERLTEYVVVPVPSSASTAISAELLPTERSNVLLITASPFAVKLSIVA